MQLNERISSFAQQHILVIGDVMIDAYIWGEHTRMSPEAPVPVVDVKRREARLGGAANVALNISALDAKATILTVVGEQGRSEEYRTLMAEAGLTLDGSVWSNERKCTLKTRVISNNRHMLRVDEEDKHDLSSSEEQSLLSRFHDLIDSGEVSGVILQDYNKGVLTTRVISEVLQTAADKGIPTMVDPKFKNFTAFKGCTLFKPNLKEMREGAGVTISQVERAELDQAVRELRMKMPHERTMVTLSEHGVYWNDGEESGIIPVFERNIIDVSGAGDTVIAVASLAVASGAHLRETALLSNLSGGLVCEHVGVQPIDKEALIREVMSL